MSRQQIWKVLPVVGCGQLEIVTEQPGEAVTITLGKILHVLRLERNLISEHPASLMSGLTVQEKAQGGTPVNSRDVCCYFSYLLSSRLYEMTERRRKATPERALAARAPPQRDIMKVHRLLAQTSETTTRATTKSTGIIMTGEWRSCVEYDQSKTPRHAVPHTTDHHALERAALLYVDLAGTIKSESAGESGYVIMIVDNFSRFKVSKFLKTKPSVVTTAALGSNIIAYITPEQVNIRAVRTDHGGEFEEESQHKIDQLGIQHKNAPPDRAHPRPTPIVVAIHG